MSALGSMVILTLLQAHTTKAQSTIFNIPSTDVVAPKKVYLEFDFISHFTSHADGGFQIYAPRVVVGVAKKVEAGINVSVVDSFAPNQPVYISPNVKVQLYNNESNGVAVAAGGLLYTPVAHRAGADTYGFIYSVVSKKVKSDYGPRVTGGAYGLPGLSDGLGTKGGAIVGYEQPLSSKVSFVTDWFSGKNRFGLLTPGFSFAVSKSSIFNVGYSINNWHNGGGRANALFIYYGITF